MHANNQVQVLYRMRLFFLRTEDIKFSNTPTSLQYTIGQSALLECVATGQPVPEMSWRFNRRKISPGKHIQAVSKQIYARPQGKGIARTRILVYLFTR
jgi:Immunoglobulin I-set domain